MMTHEFDNENMKADLAEVMGDLMADLWAEVNAIEYGEPTAVQTVEAFEGDLEEENLPF